MPNTFTQELVIKFNDSELVALLEASRIALGDSEIFEMVAEDMDLSDKEMSVLRDKLHDFMNQE